MALTRLTFARVGSRGADQINAMSTWAFHFEEYDKTSIFAGKDLELYI